MSGVDVDYRGFGEYGPSFQEMHEAIWQVAQQLWTSSFKPLAHAELTEAVRMVDRSTNWLTEVFKAALLEDGFVTSSDVDDFWERFRQTFRPALNEHHHWSAQHPGHREIALSMLVTQVYAEATRDRRIAHALGQLNRISFGPFREDELEYLAREHSWMVEIGGGSGYFANCFIHNGGEIHSYDDNSYCWDENPMPWYQTLRQCGVLADGGPEVLDDYANRTLLISWPQAGSDFPVESLRRYRSAGGKYFAFKFGGLCGFTKTSGDTGVCITGNAGAKNVRAFFEELIEHWIELEHPNRPQFSGYAQRNNLWVFERR